MAIFRINRAQGFFQASNDTFRDNRLSAEARGTLAYLLTHDGSFRLSSNLLMQQMNLGRDKLRRVMRELKQYGYLSLSPGQCDSNGQFTGQKWDVFAESQLPRLKNATTEEAEIPYLPPEDELPLTDYPNDGKTDSRKNRQSENPSDYKNTSIRENTSIEEYNKKSISRSVKLTDSEWLDSLKAKQVYRQINVDAEYEKAQIWCETNNRMCTRRFFVNWLNRAKPMEAITNVNDPSARRIGKTGYPAKPTPAEIIANRDYSGFSSPKE